MNCSSLWLHTIYMLFNMTVLSLQKSMLVTSVIFPYQQPVIISWPDKSKEFLLFPTWFPQGTSQLTILKFANVHWKFQLASTSLHQRSMQSTKCCNRLCGHSSGIRGMCQVSHSNGSMTLLISEVADLARRPSTRMQSKAGFWRGTTPAGNSLSSTQVGWRSELPVLAFKSQIAYGNSKALLQVPSYFQHS